jgi:hypothetical protein
MVLLPWLVCPTCEGWLKGQLLASTPPMIAITTDQGSRKGAKTQRGEFSNPIDGIGFEGCATSGMLI